MRARLLKLGALMVAVAATVAGLGIPTSAVEGPGQTGIQDAPVFERIPPDVRAALGNRIVPEGYDAGTKGPNAPEQIRQQTNGSMLVFPESRQMWQIYAYPFRVGGGVAIRDLDTMRLLRAFDLGTTRVLDRSTTALRGGEWTHAVDPGKRVFLFALGHSDDEIIEIDMRTLAVRARYPLFPRTPNSYDTVSRLIGLEYDGLTDSLVALFNTPIGQGEALSATYIVRLDLKTKTSKIRQLNACDGQQPASTGYGQYNLQVLVSHPRQYVVPCQRSGNVTAMVAVDRSLEPDAAEHVTVGPTAMEAAFIDQRRQRIFAVTSLGEVWVYDVATGAFVGLVSTSARAGSDVKNGYGLDRETGRLFFQSMSFGFGVAEGSFFPIPQAVTRLDRQAEGQERIWSDNRTGRVFVLEGRDDVRRGYRVYQVGRAPAPPPPANPDTLTVDREERPGVTEADLHATAAGYGARVLFARGVSTILPAPAFGTVNPVADLVANKLNSRCGFDERELLAGRIRNADYDAGSSVATAVEVDLDEGSQVHIDQPSRCHVEGRHNSTAVSTQDLFGTGPAGVEPLDNPDRDTNPRYGRAPATCSAGNGYAEPADGRSQSKAYGQTAAAGLGSATVACPLTTEGELKGDARTRLDGAIRVESAYSTVSVDRLTEGGKTGVRSTITAVARGIDIAGVIQIGEVRATATSFSNGRKRSGNGSSYDASIYGVVVNGQTVCAAGKECPKDEVLAVLNRLGTGRIQFRIGGGFDQDLFRGSPGGVLTAVQKSAERQASDQALIGDFATEVPALEMVVYNENNTWGRARQIYQFAGVSTTASYAISLLPTGTELPEIPDTTVIEPGTPAIPPVPGTPGSANGSNGSGQAIGGDGASDGVIAAIARGLRLLLTSPRQALLLMTAWAVLGLPFILARRRRLLAELADA